uniref:Immunoglobulin domain-containing protein n=1 Tax=Anopheles culicifacies TaxID=139723 RepID=A0A182M5L2_9DIPT
MCECESTVAWMHFEQSAILTVHNHVITRNPRISVTHDKHDKHKTWFLHITNVQEEDKGRYMCQINTVTAKTQFGYLHVVDFSRHHHGPCRKSHNYGTELTCCTQIEQSDRRPDSCPMDALLSG